MGPAAAGKGSGGRFGADVGSWGKGQVVGLRAGVVCWGCRAYWLTVYGVKRREGLQTAPGFLAGAPGEQRSYFFQGERLWGRVEAERTKDPLWRHRFGRSC